MEVFLTAWFCHTPLQSRSFRRHLQELSNRILSKWSIHIPHCITWFSFVVYCQVERWFLIIHLCRTMASERFVKENRAKCVVAGLCYGTEWPTRYFAIAAFWSSLGGPNQFFIAGFSVNLKLYITPFQLSTLIVCSEPEVEWQEPPGSSLQDFRILVAKFASLKHQVLFCVWQGTSGSWAISLAKIA